MAERSAAQIAATRRWMAYRPLEFEEWLKKQPARPRPPRPEKPLFESQRIPSGLPGPKIVVLAAVHAEAVAWINDPDNMRAPDSGKMTKFVCHHGYNRSTFRFSHWAIRFAFKMRFAAPK